MGVASPVSETSNMLLLLHFISGDAQFCGLQATFAFDTARIYA